MGRHSPAPPGWITVNRVSLDYGVGGNRRLVIGMCKRAGIPLRKHGHALCLRLQDLADLLWWIDNWRDSSKLPR